jgi:hypothetical protein
MQDFAKFRADRDLGASRAHSAAWSPDILSLVIGILLGIAACLVGLKVSQAKVDQTVFIKAAMIVEEVVEKPLVFDFYEALKSYVVLPRS